MILRADMFPYPVLHPDMDDYVDNNDFSAEIKLELTGDTRVKGHVDFYLGNEDLLKLLDEDKICFIVHVEGISSCCRFIKYSEVGKTVIDFEISRDQLREKLQINTALVTKKYIETYSNSKFNRVYYEKGYTVKGLEKGSILAFQDMREFRLEFEGVNLSSMIRVSGSSDKLMNVDFDGDVITLKLPQKTYELYRNLSRSDKKAQELFVVIFVLPVLTQAIIQLQQGNTGDESKWQQALVDLLEEKTPNWSATSALIVAQNVLGDIVDRGVVGFFDREGAEYDE